MPSYDDEPVAAMAAESRPRAHHGRRASEDTGGFQPVRQIQGNILCRILKKPRCSGCLMTLMMKSETRLLIKIGRRVFFF